MMNKIIRFLLFSCIYIISASCYDSTENYEQLALNNSASDGLDQYEKTALIVGFKDGVSINDTMDRILSNGSSIGSRSIYKNKLIIKRVHAINSIAKRLRMSIHSSLSDNALFNMAYKNMSPEEKKLYRSYKIIFNIDVPVNDLIDKFKIDPEVEYVQLNRLNQLYYDPNDCLYDLQWGLKRIVEPAAWDISQGSDIVVAVIDTGIDYRHPDLRKNLWKDENGKYGYDFSNNDNNPFDILGHGTHVAGIIGAVGNNYVGIIGVAPKVKIMSVKIFPNSYDDVCANAIRYAVDNGARVINNSWGPGERNPSNPVIEDAINYSYSKDVVVVCAAGNNSDDVQYYSPANHVHAVAVAASNNDGNLWKWLIWGSNYGDLIDVAAPGENILSTFFVPFYYIYFSGTSMAAPHISGIAALLLAKDPLLTNEEVEDIIKSTGVPVSGQNFNIPDAYEALMSVP